MGSAFSRRAGAIYNRAALVVTVGWLVLVASCSFAPLSDKGISSNSSSGPGSTVYRGLNLYGSFVNAFSSQSWAFPSASELDYYKRKGLTNFRVPLLWENLQPHLFGPFDRTYLAAMDQFVANSGARGERVSFTFINHGSYPAQGGYPIGSPQVPAAAFYDLWTKMALHYRGEPTVWAYDLMNEPFDDPGWTSTHAQGAIDSIRAVDRNKVIIVMPEQESAPFWSSAFPGYTDPTDHLWYEAHVYFDQNSEGEYQQTYDKEGAYPNVGLDRAAPFVDWCKAHDVRCTMGEFGIPGEPTGGQTRYDQRWLAVLDHFLFYLDRNGISGDYWSAGPYGDTNSVEPIDGHDQPQMAILERHLGR
jgi:endoglucanase